MWYLRELAFRAISNLYNQNDICHKCFKTLNNNNIYVDEFNDRSVYCINCANLYDDIR